MSSNVLSSAASAPGLSLACEGRWPFGHGASETLGIALRTSIYIYIYIYVDGRSERQ